MFCCMLLYVHSSISIILMGKRELVALLNLSPWCLVMVEQLFLPVQWVCLWFVIVVFPDHTYLLFLVYVFGGVVWEPSFCGLFRQIVGHCGEVGCGMGAVWLPSCS